MSIEITQYDEVQIDLIRGDTERFDFTFEDMSTAVGNQDGVPIDITGSTLWMTVKNDYTDADADAIIQKEVTSHDDPTGGKTHATFTATDTALLTMNKYYYMDAQYKSAAGSIATVLRAKAKCLYDVTKATS